MGEERPVIFFDLDNTLYSRGLQIHNLMVERIHAYFKNNLKVSSEEAETLHKRYYKDYGLALQGLVLHHKIDALDYDRQVDQALPLEKVLKPDKELRDFLVSIDSKKYKRWIFTNAYITHANRCLDLLGIRDLFDGITYCDYNELPLRTKPQPIMFERAMAQAQIADKSKCIFVDDSALNVKAAMDFGWKKCILLLEGSDKVEWDTTGIEHVISDVKHMRTLLPELFLNSKKH